jgi:tellurite resistance protein
MHPLEPGRARYVAAFVSVLCRAARADLEMSPDEADKMIDILESTGPLSRAQATEIVLLARSQNRRTGGTEDFLVTREFRAMASDEECRRLLHAAFTVCAADKTISAEEDAKLRQIASELGIQHAEYIAARQRHST